MKLYGSVHGSTVNRTNRLLWEAGYTKRIETGYGGGTGRNAFRTRVLQHPSTGDTIGIIEIPNLWWPSHLPEVHSVNIVSAASASRAKAVLEQTPRPPRDEQGELVFAVVPEFQNATELVDVRQTTADIIRAHETLAQSGMKAPDRREWVGGQTSPIVAGIVAATNRASQTNSEPAQGPPGVFGGAAVLVAGVLVAVAAMIWWGVKR